MRYVGEVEGRALVELRPRELATWQELYDAIAGTDESSGAGRHCRANVCGPITAFLKELTAALKHGEKCSTHFTTITVTKGIRVEVTGKEV